MKIKALILTLVVTIFFTQGCSTFETKHKDLDLMIVHTNDVHGRMVYDKENNVSGYSKMDTYISKLREKNKNLMLFDAGDVFHGQPIATVSKGETVVSLMNLIGYDYCVPGNHDFNYGYDRLKELSQTMSFKILAANLYLQNGEMPFVENDIKNIDNVKIGIFGLVTPETVFKTNPKNVENLKFEDPVETAKNQVSKLRSEGADIIIAVCHLGISDKSICNRSYDVRDAVDGLDLIIDGHSHSTLDKINQVEGKAVITSAGNYTENLGIVKISMHNGLKTILPENIPFSELDQMEPSAKIDEQLEKINNQLSPMLNQIIGNSEVYLDGTKSIVRKEETYLTKLVTDAIIKETNAQMVFINSGSFKNSINIGDITINDIIKVFPFGNCVITKSVKGEDIIKSLEIAFSEYPYPSVKFPQIAGATCVIDKNSPIGSRVKSVTIGGHEIELKKTYILATSDFIANGGDGYDLIGNSPDVNYFSGLDEIFINYIKNTSPITETFVKSFDSGNCLKVN